MVGNGRTAHVHDGGNIDDAFFHVAENPENFQPRGIAELFQQDGYIVDCLLGRQAADDTFFIISMVVRKSVFIFVIWYTSLEIIFLNCNIHRKMAG